MGTVAPSHLPSLAIEKFLITSSCRGPAEANPFQFMDEPARQAAALTRGLAMGFVVKSDRCGTGPSWFPVVGRPAQFEETHD